MVGALLGLEKLMIETLVIVKTVGVVVVVVLTGTDVVVVLAGTVVVVVAGGPLLASARIRHQLSADDSSMTVSPRKSAANPPLMQPCKVHHGVQGCALRAELGHLRQS